jgi:hypothetical protein
MLGVCFSLIWGVSRQRRKIKEKIVLSYYSVPVRRMVSFGAKGGRKTSSWIDETLSVPLFGSCSSNAARIYLT